MTATEPLSMDEYRILERLQHPSTRTYARQRLASTPLVVLERMAAVLEQAAGDVRNEHAARRQRVGGQRDG